MRSARGAGARRGWYKKTHRLLEEAYYFTLILIEGDFLAEVWGVLTSTRCFGLRNAGLFG